MSHIEVMKGPIVYLYSAKVRRQAKKAIRMSERISALIYESLIVGGAKGDKLWAKALALKPAARAAEAETWRLAKLEGGHA